jgi:MFS superfamily sulfate permease-like transporter
VNTDIRPRSPDEYVNYVLLVSMIGGAIQLICGIFRLGFLVNFLSKPILSGFTTAAAILIGMTQVRLFFTVYLVLIGQIPVWCPTRERNQSTNLLDPLLPWKSNLYTNLY